MNITLAQIVVWLIIGLIGGTIAGIVVKWQRTGFGFWANFGIGLVGALVGGLIFRIFNLLPDLEQIAISLRDVAAATVGSLIFLVALWIWQHFSR
ncbi:MAG: GlsB/YeaQ/YmgE family stress response membrane protein [Proteobacteria bacterium]|jgi:uncharacterized membrane protein YeaQ/YmgE (transglycosylase-associated protein family)|nr:MAG: GlsB/YeaQ/YmgE family stress response membrane protein [Pseudomonadota bacterium]